MGLWASEDDAIVVTAEQRGSRIVPPVSDRTRQALLERQPRNVADALTGLPGVTTQTNSRGETIARIRGSEERQTQVFLDGTPLAVPWDGRADIGILPAGLIGSIHVIKGPAPVEYGPNAVAGAIDLKTRSANDRRLTATASQGSGGFGDASVVGSIPLETWM